MDPTEPVGDEASHPNTPCPGCGLQIAPQRTSGPLLCPNCGHRGAVSWTDEPRARRARPDDDGLRVPLTAGERRALHARRSSTPGDRIRVRLAR